MRGLSARPGRWQGLAAGALGLALVALGGGAGAWPAALGLIVVAAAGGAVVGQRPGRAARWGALGVAAAALALAAARIAGAAVPGGGAGLWAGVAGVWLGAWMLVALVAEEAAGRRGAWRVLAPAAFGITLLWLWEVAVAGLGVPQAILPAPSAIGAKMAAAADVLWTDFVQTIVKGALSGYALGAGAAVAVAVAVDRSPFLQRGLLPVGNFVAALPIVGIAPILVMWFGFDWQSKAAVVVVMVFFPVLVNTLAGLQATDRAGRDLMATWGAGYWQALWKLRLPAAMPFVFNGLKIATTLALIGAIVAEFFGSPIKGMGFRISTEVGRLQLDMVWAEIAVAALAGSAFYGLVAAMERRVTFWHPSQRGRAGGPQRR
jgi:NitT/TauT family transport system permease protein